MTAAMPSTNRSSPQSRMLNRSRLLYQAAEGAALAHGHSDSGQEVIAPTRHRDQEIPRQPHDHDDRPEKNSELLGHAATNNTLKRTRLLGHGHAIETNQHAAAIRDGGFLALLGDGRLREEVRLTDGDAALRRVVRLANLAQDGKHMLLAGQGPKHRAFRQCRELSSGVILRRSMSSWSSRIKLRTSHSSRGTRTWLSSVSAFMAGHCDANCGLKQD